MDLSLLPAPEQQTVFQVLQRDKLLRTVEEERIRRMKRELQELRRKGAKSFAREYGERTCARCQRPLGKFWNTGAVCHGCSHRICSKCRVRGGTVGWKCTVCHAYREVKIKSGEWFLEEKAKKFPVTSGKYETVGDKMLKTYNVLSHITILPPTPPQHLNYQFLSSSGDLNKRNAFPKSMEDLLMSSSSHVRKISTSQNDVRGDLLKVGDTKPGSFFLFSTQKSLSDTHINRSLNLFKGPSLPNLFKKNKDSDHDGSSTEESSSTCSGGNRGSYSSINTVCSVLDGAGASGELELALAFSSDASCLEITVGACRNLPYGDTRKRKTHPYVKAYVLPDKSHKLQTTVKRNTTEPVFNEVLKYPTERHLLMGKRLQATVWHSRTLNRKVFLGEVLVPLDGLRSDENEILQGFNWYPLCPKQRDSPEGGAVE